MNANLREAPVVDPLETQCEEVGLEAMLERVARAVAPLWPLKQFVAVNPFLGLMDRRFEEAADILERTAAARMTLPRSWYLEAIADGRIRDSDLAAALGEAKVGPGVPRSVLALRIVAKEEDSPAPRPVSTLADLAGEITGQDWNAFIQERISSWAAGYYDQGQASWRSPWRERSPFAAWRAQASLDLASEIAGLRGARATFRGLPASPLDAAAAVLRTLKVSGPGLEIYLRRLLMTISGWAAFARYHDWQGELQGEAGRSAMEILAVRLAWELALLKAFGDKGLGKAWERALCEKRREAKQGGRNALAIDLILHSAYEKSRQRELLKSFSRPTESRTNTSRPALQAAFCIDVRSEVFRRALEASDSGTDTIGFAGFFGSPFEFVPFGHESGTNRCPVLLAPRFTVTEKLNGAGREEEDRLLRRERWRQLASRAWQSFRQGAVSSFGFAETMGLGYAVKLATDNLGWTRPVARRHRNDAVAGARFAPGLELTEIAGRAAGIDAGSRIELAENILRGMSLTGDFARLVLLAGHGATTANNPYASGFDCGACGGHSGEANARVAAMILNDSSVRDGLRDRGIEVARDTVFLAGLHDTTTDEVTLYEEDGIPTSHREDLARLNKALEAATDRARAERAGRLNLERGKRVGPSIVARSRDWSQVRPEWGLAGCAAFIAAPRSRTRNLDLSGKAFLHSYDWRKDAGFNTLEVIMTAPLIVASWISLQYYGSAVDNRIFGSGNKVLHNVVGHLGVLEGHGGDLRVGLPWQSVHDGERLIHEPLRLTVLLEAPTEAINAVIRKHQELRDLLDNGWLHLFAMNAEGRVSHRYLGDFCWKETSANPDHHPGERCAA